MGYITIDRKIFDHFLWVEKRQLSKFEAWLDLIQLVSWKEVNEIIIKGTVVKWGRGQFPVSLSFLSKRWNWGEKKVRLYLQLLEKEGQIGIQRTPVTTVITLCKYDTYNQQGQGEGSKKDTQRTETGHPEDTQRTPIKEDNNSKEDKKDNKEINILMSELSASDKLYEKIAFSFWVLFKKKMSEYGITSTDLEKSKAKKWVSAVRLMIESDQRTENEIREVFKYLKNEKPNTKGFAWSKNIRSTETLRNQFEKVLIQARNFSNNGSKISNDYKKRIIEEVTSKAI